MRRFAASLALIVLAGTLAAAQSAAPPRFEAASIRRSLLNEGRVGWGYQPGGRFVMHRQAVSVLIRQAYPEATDLLGAPDWVTSDAYDVEAKAAGNPPRDEMRRMLRSLLSDRFKLKAHYETEERPVYALVLARADRPPALHWCDPRSIARRSPRRSARAAHSLFPLRPAAPHHAG